MHPRFNPFLPNYPGVVATPDDSEYCVETVRELRKSIRRYRIITKFTNVAQMVNSKGSSSCEVGDSTAPEVQIPWSWWWNDDRLTYRPEKLRLGT